MERAVKAAILAGGIKDLPYEQQIYVANALLILKEVTDEEKYLQPWRAKLNEVHNTAMDGSIGEGVPEKCKGDSRLPT